MYWIWVSGWENLNEGENCNIQQTRFLSTNPERNDGYKRRCAKLIDFNIVLFDGFGTLDVYEPAEIIGKMPAVYNLEYFSSNGGMVSSSQKIQTQTRPFCELNPEGALLIPGGMGTRTLVDDADYIRRLALAANSASYVLTVCTGSALLAKTGLLDMHKATSNKRAFDWVQSISDTVIWIKQARWVVDGRFYTSSGVSGGMDMTLGFIADLHGLESAKNVAHAIEYIWNSDKSIDPFAH